jgi:DUF4097 and DUF4098 domain-containing protein YvlB
MRRGESFVAAFLALAVGSGEAGAEVWNRSYKVAAHPSLDVRTADGSVEVRSWDRPEIAIHVETEGWKIGPDGVRVEAEQHDNAVTLTVRETSFDISLFSFHDRRIRVTLDVPRELDARIHTGDGAVELAPLTGTIRVSTGDGRIRAQGLKGDLTLGSGDGRITATDLDGRLSVRTGDGDVDLAGRFDVLDIQTGDGSIEAAARDGSRVSQDGWTITSGDGPVSLELPNGFAADLEARTGDGHISVALEGGWRGEVNGHRVRGTLNGGGGPLRIRTGDGSVEIGNREAAKSSTRSN